MTTLFEITYEGQTAGTTVGAESGWDGTLSGTRVYDATYVAAGAMACKITGQGILRKNVTATAATRVRFYLQLPTAAPGTNAKLVEHRSSTTIRCGLRLEAAGTLRLLNVNTAAGSSSTALSDGQPVRVEYWTDGAAGTQGADIFRGANINGTTPDEQLSGTFTNATYDNMSVSFQTLVTSFVVYSDEIKATDVPAAVIGGVLTSVTAARVTSWTAAGAVTGGRATTWTAAAALTATRATTWTAATSVTTSRATTWTARAVAAATRATSWTVSAAVTSTRASTWAAAGSVTASRSTTWQARAAVQTSRATTWTAAAAVSATRSTSWQARAAATGTTTTTWTAAAALTATRATTWAVAAVLTPVTASRAATWATSAAVTSLRATTWSARAQTTDTRAASWATAETVTTGRSAAWATSTATATTRSAAWDVLAPAAATRSTTWAVLVLRYVPRPASDPVARPFAGVVSRP